MAIAFGFSGYDITPLKQGFDALAEAQRIQLARAMQKIQIGQTFNDPLSIAAGLRDMGLTQTAREYEEYQTGMPTQPVPQMPPSQDVIRDKNVQAPQTQETPKAKPVSETQSKTPGKEVLDISDAAINKFIYNAKNLSDSTMRAQNLYTLIAEKKGIDAANKMLGTINASLKASYQKFGKEGQFVPLQGELMQRGGGSGGGKKEDYVVIADDGSYKQVSAENAEAAVAKGKGVYAIKGTQEDVIKAIQPLMSSEAGLQQAGITYSKGGLFGMFGDKVYKKGGKELAPGEVIREMYKIMAKQAKETQSGTNGGITALKKARNK